MGRRHGGPRWETRGVLRFGRVCWDGLARAGVERRRIVGNDRVLFDVCCSPLSDAAAVRPAPLAAVEGADPRRGQGSTQRPSISTLLLWSTSRSRLKPCGWGYRHVLLDTRLADLKPWRRWRRLNPNRLRLFRFWPSHPPRFRSGRPAPRGALPRMSPTLQPHLAARPRAQGGLAARGETGGRHPRSGEACGQ